MTQSKRIVITGGIATGKSTASRMLADMGCPVIDADAIARALILPGGEAYRAVIDTFGTGIVQSDGTIDRKALGAIVFPSEPLRQKLNAITHPKVRTEIGRRLEAHRDAPIVFLDIPLYYETEDLPAYPVWLIYAPKQVQLTRLMQRDQLTRQEALDRIGAQWDIERKRRLADRVIDNTKNRAHLKTQLRAALSEILEDKG